MSSRLFKIFHAVAAGAWQSSKWPHAFVHVQWPGYFPRSSSNVLTTLVSARVEMSPSPSSSLHHQLHQSQRSARLQDDSAAPQRRQRSSPQGPLVVCRKCSYCRS